MKAGSMTQEGKKRYGHATKRMIGIRNVEGIIHKVKNSSTSKHD